MKAEEILAEFQFLGNRVSRFHFDTGVIDAKARHAELLFEFDYNVKGIEKHDNNLIGIIVFIANAGQRVKRNYFLKLPSLWKVHLLVLHRLTI